MKRKIKIEYSKWTFILSVIGFIGQVVFWIGVYLQVDTATDNLETESKVELVKQLEAFEKENEQLKRQLFLFEEKQ